MKLKELLTNKKVIIVACIIVLALIVGGVILVTKDSKKTGNKDTDTKTEQNNENMDANDKNDNGEGLEVLEPNEVAPEDSSSTSGSWGDELGTNTQTGNTNPTPSDQPNDTAKEEKDKDILEDDIAYGNIY